MRRFWLFSLPPRTAWLLNIPIFLSRNRQIHLQQSTMFCRNRAHGTRFIIWCPNKGPNAFCRLCKSLSASHKSRVRRSKAASNERFGPSVEVWPAFLPSFPSLICGSRNRQIPRDDACPQSIFFHHRTYLECTVELIGFHRDPSCSRALSSEIGGGPLFHCRTQRPGAAWL